MNSSIDYKISICQTLEDLNFFMERLVLDETDKDLIRVLREFDLLLADLKTDIENSFKEYSL